MGVLWRRIRSARAADRLCWQASGSSYALGLPWRQPELARSFGRAAVACCKPLGGLLGRR